MLESSEQKIFWERKILKWEHARYSPWAAVYPMSWTVRGRLRRASQIISRMAPAHWRLLELGCGSGLLALKLEGIYAQYTGVDIARNAIEQAKQKVRAPGFSFVAADVSDYEPREADLTIFLGLTDWLSPQQLRGLLARIRSPHILFSYSQVARWNPYRFYRYFTDQPREDRVNCARNYNEWEIVQMLSDAGYAFKRLTPVQPLNPSVLVWATKR